MILNDPLNRHVTEGLNAMRLSYSGGLPLDKSLVAASRVCKGWARESFVRASEAVQRNEDFDEAMLLLRGHLSYADRAMLSAGFVSGNLPLSLERVVERRALMHEARSNTRNGLILPTIILTIALIVVPLPKWLLGNMSDAEYARRVCVPMVIYFGVIFFFKTLARLRARRASNRSLHDPLPRTSVMDILILSIPLLNVLERIRNRAMIAMTLGAATQSGIRVLDALKLTESVTPNGVFRRVVRQLYESAKRGTSISEAMSPQVWPYQWRAMVEVGETSGKLDESLIRLGRMAHDTYANTIREASRWLPRIIYAMIAAYIAYQIITMALAIRSQIDNLTNQVGGV